jgi:hypothetical protein
LNPESRCAFRWRPSPALNLLLNLDANCVLSVVAVPAANLPAFCLDDATGILIQAVAVIAAVHREKKAISGFSARSGR